MLFTTPRDLYINEDLAFNMGSDLNDVNTNTDRLSIILNSEDGTSLPIAVKFVSQIIYVMFLDSTNIITSG